ncbi:MAG: hypothetical protein IPL95_03215 [Saprospiraceae bacterium]|nr:hypothetical protein [Saprospiraceae bacterium]
MVTDGTKLGTTKVEKDSGLISLGFVEYNGYMYYLDGTQHHKLVKTNGIIKQNVYNTGSFNENIVEIKTFIKNNKLYYFL